MTAPRDAALAAAVEALESREHDLSCLADAVTIGPAARDYLVGLGVDPDARPLPCTCDLKHIHTILAALKERGRALADVNDAMAFVMGALNAATGEEPVAMFVPELLEKWRRAEVRQAVAAETVRLSGVTHFDASAERLAALDPVVRAAVAEHRHGDGALMSLALREAVEALPEAVRKEYE